MIKKKILVVGNWKMNPNTHTEASSLFSEIKETASNLQNVQTVICPPFVFLDMLAQMYSGHRILFGGENLFYETSGKYTGEISGSQLYSVGADYVIIGHSERRALGETNEDVEKKVKAARESGLTPIVCFGEEVRDSAGDYLAFLREQITSALTHVKPNDVDSIIFAYEPIWAIGKTGKDAITPHMLHETMLYIRRVLREAYGKKVSESATVIYGGSVKAENSEQLLREGETDGFLVGGASLKADSFNNILEIANTI